MAMNIGTSELAEAYLGSTPIEHIYLGNQIVWEKAVEEYISFVDSVAHTICSTNWGDYNETVITDNGDNTVNIVVTFKSMLNTTLKKSKVVSSQTNVDNTGGEYTPGTTKEAVGITATQCAAVTAVNYNLFTSNRNIHSFDEFQYFTKLTALQKMTFQTCQSLTSVILPANITSMGEYAFATSKIGTLIIPDKVKNVDRYQFNGCSSLTSITIGESVTSLGNYCFNSCNNLATIICKCSSPPSVAQYTFGRTASTAAGRTNYNKGTNKLYVPYGTSANFNTSYWASRLLSASYCGFTIYELDINGNIPNS